MHFLVLVTAEIPEVKEDLQKNQTIEQQLHNIRERLRADGNNSVLGIAEKHLSSITTTFARAVEEHVDKILYPYGAEVDDPRYLEFDDRTDILRNDYENGRADCIQLPNGTIVEASDYSFCSKFTVSNGEVFQSHAGPFYQMKRTKKAKKMKVLSAYPYARLFKSLDDFAQSRGIPFDEQRKRYGYWFNPNVIWDFYTIGGRWQDLFLVKDTCRDFSCGERSFGNSSGVYEAPEGYMWVCAARKKDIEWEVMRTWYKQKASERFERLKQMFESGRLEKGTHGTLTADGIMGFADYLYRKDDCLVSYRQRCDISFARLYPVIAHDLLDADDWIAKYNTSKEGTFSWYRTIDSYIYDLSDDTVITGVDCHL